MRKYRVKIFPEQLAKLIKELRKWNGTSALKQPWHFEIVAREYEIEEITKKGLFPINHKEGV